jgi:RNA polymerase sigma-70 factor (ECF subfamily)
MVYAFFAYQVPPDVAEDLTSITFERVVRFWSTFDHERGRTRAWVIAIARNVLADHFRKRAAERVVSLEAHPHLGGTTSPSDDPLAQRLSLETVKQWLSLLDHRQQEIIALRYGADMAPRQIAEVVGLTEANVQQILSRGLRRLANELAAEYPRRSARRAAKLGRARHEPEGSHEAPLRSPAEAQGAAP